MGIFRIMAVLDPDMSHSMVRIDVGAGTGMYTDDSLTNPTRRQRLHNFGVDELRGCS